MDATDRITPYCFILDDGYRVVMAGPSDASDPLGHLYDAASAVDALPGPIDRAVRALTASWRTSSDEILMANAAVKGLHLTVAPLHGSDGYRIAVFIRRPLSVVA